jgi:hypothetical protein
VKSPQLYKPSIKKLAVFSLLSLMLSLHTLVSFAGNQVGVDSEEIGQLPPQPQKSLRKAFGAASLCLAVVAGYAGYQSSFGQDFYWTARDYLVGRFTPRDIRDEKRWIEFDDEGEITEIEPGIAYMPFVLNNLSKSEQARTHLTDEFPGKEGPISLKVSSIRTQHSLLADSSSRRLTPKYNNPH